MEVVPLLRSFLAPHLTLFSLGIRDPTQGPSSSAESRLPMNGINRAKPGPENPLQNLTDFYHSS